MWKFLFILAAVLAVFIVVTNSSYQEGSVIINEKITSLLAPLYDWYDGRFVSDNEAPETSSANGTATVVDSW